MSSRASCKESAVTCMPVTCMPVTNLGQQRSDAEAVVGVAGESSLRKILVGSPFGCAHIRCAVLPLLHTQNQAS